MPFRLPIIADALINMYKSSGLGPTALVQASIFLSTRLRGLREGGVRARRYINNEG